ncbi:MAG: lectin-like protein, partial [Myxococcota bacterium]
DNAGDQAALLGEIMDDHWIGISDLGEEGEWYTVEDDLVYTQGMSQGFAGWAMLQPGGGVIENCAELDPGQGGWADSGCLQMQPTICEHPA